MTRDPRATIAATVGPSASHLAVVKKLTPFLGDDDATLRTAACERLAVCLRDYGGVDEHKLMDVYLPSLVALATRDPGEPALAALGATAWHARAGSHCAELAACLDPLLAAGPRAEVAAPRVHRWAIVSGHPRPAFEDTVLRAWRVLARLALGDEIGAREDGEAFAGGRAALPSVLPMSTNHQHAGDADDLIACAHIWGAAARLNAAAGAPLSPRRPAPKKPKTVTPAERDAWLGQAERALEPALAHVAPRVEADLTVEVAPGERHPRQARVWQAWAFIQGARLARARGEDTHPRLAMARRVLSTLDPDYARALAPTLDALA